MKIRILPSALKDLARGRRFYERQGEGLGNYFMNTLFSDIDSLALYGGIHLKVGNGAERCRLSYPIQPQGCDERRAVQRENPFLSAFIASLRFHGLPSSLAATAQSPVRAQSPRCPKAVPNAAFRRATVSPAPRQRLVA